MAFLSKRAAALALAATLCACAPQQDDAAPVAPKPAAAQKPPRAVKTADVDPLPQLSKKVDPLSSLGPRDSRAAGTRAMLARIPKDALLVLRFPHIERLREAWSRTALQSTLDQLTSDPQFAALSGGGTSASEAWSRMLADLLIEKPEVKKLLDLLPSLQGELIVAMTGPCAEDPSAIPVQFALLFDAKGRSAELKDALEPLLESRGADTPANFTRKKEGWRFEFGEAGTAGEITCEGEIFSCFVGARPGVRRLHEQANSQTEAKSFLASEIAHATPDFALDGSEVIFEGFANLAPLREFAMAMLPPPVLGRVRASGLLKLEGVSAAVALEGEGLSEALVWCSPGQRDLFSRSLTSKPLERAMARWIPAQCDNAGMYSIDLESLLTDVRVLLPEEGRRDMERAIDDLRRFRGIDLDNDLFANLGTTLVMVSHGDLADWVREGTPSLCLVVPIEKEDAARRLLGAAFEDPAVKEREQVAQVAGCDVHTYPIEADGALGHTFSLSWAIDQGCLVLATDVALISSCIESAHASNETANTPFREALGRADASAWCIGLSSAGDGLPPTVAIGRTNEAALVLEARKGSGALVTSGALGLTGMFSGVAIPHLMQARNQANERAAVACLRSIWSAEHQAIEARFLDRDRDGTGEALFLDELGGARTLRGGSAALERPPFSCLGATCSEGLLERSGYVFRVDLPPQTGEAWVATDAQGAVSADRSELAFVAYAWPKQTGMTGVRVFAIDSLGDVWSSDNIAQHYEGRDKAPAWSASGLTGRDDGVTARVRKGGDGASWARVE